MWVSPSPDQESKRKVKKRKLKTHLLYIFRLCIFRYNGRVLGNLYGPGTGPIWLDEMQCVDNERSIANCYHRGWGTHNCNHQQDVSVSCGSSPVQYGWFCCYHSRCEALVIILAGEEWRCLEKYVLHRRDLGDVRYWPNITPRGQVVLDGICYSYIRKGQCTKMPILSILADSMHTKLTTMARRTDISKHRAKG